MTGHTATLRERTDADLPALAKMLERQQAQTGYPHRWPLRSPVDQFIKRDNELRAWVAVLGEQIVGHVSVTTVGADGERLTVAWSKAHGVGVEQLRCVSVLFTDPEFAGRGIGRTLLQTATAYASSHGYPVLDVVAANERPVRMYERNGWRTTATLLAPWSPEEPVLVHAMILPTSQPSTDG